MTCHTANRNGLDLKQTAKNLEIIFPGDCLKRKMIVPHYPFDKTISSC